MRRGLTPAIRKPEGRGWVCAASGNTKAVSTGSDHGPAGKVTTRAGKLAILVRRCGPTTLARRPGLAHEAAVDDRMALGEDRRTIIQSRPGDAARAHSLSVEQVDCRKWNIQRIGAQNLGRILASDLGTPLFWRTDAEVAQCREPPLANDL